MIETPSPVGRDHVRRYENGGIRLVRATLSGLILLASCALAQTSEDLLPPGVSLDRGRQAPVGGVLAQDLPQVRRGEGDRLPCLRAGGRGLRFVH